MTRAKPMITTRIGESMVRMDPEGFDAHRRDLFMFGAAFVSIMDGVAIHIPYEEATKRPLDPEPTANEVDLSAWLSKPR